MFNVAQMCVCASKLLCCKFICMQRGKRHHHVNAPAPSTYTINEYSSTGKIYLTFYIFVERFCCTTGKYRRAHTDNAPEVGLKWDKGKVATKIELKE